MAISKKVRRLVYAKYGGHCAYCGKKLEMKDMQVDHLVPILRGDSDEYIQSHNAGYDKYVREHKELHLPIQSYEDYKIVRGKDDISNYMPACRQCNFRKGTSDLETFRQEIRRQAEGVMKTFQGRMSEAYGLIEFHDKPVVFYFERVSDNDYEVHFESNADGSFTVKETK